MRLVLATAPAKPTNLTATAAGNAQIDLAWTAPVDDGGRAVSGYKVEVSDDGSTGSWSDLEADTASTDTAYSHSGLSAGDTRHYRVSAINAAGTSEASDSDEATTRLTVPDPPAGLAAIADGTSKIVVSWRAPANTGGSAVTGYKVQASENGVSDWSNLVEDTTDTSYTHSGLSAGATRHYRVYARNAQGESQPSDVVYDTTQPTATTCTEGPDDLWCGVVTVGEIDCIRIRNRCPWILVGVSVQPVRDKTFTYGTNSYTIDKSVGVGTAAVGDLRRGTFSFSLTSALTATEKEKLELHVGSRSFAFSDAGGRQRSFRYLHMVRCRPRLVRGGQRHAAAAPRAGGAGRPDEPHGRGRRGHAKIDLTWTAPADDGGSAITGYRIEVSNNGSSNWNDLVADTGSAATSYTHEGLSPGDTRHYRVSAINATRHVGGRPALGRRHHGRPADAQQCGGSGTFGVRRYHES